MRNVSLKLFYAEETVYLKTKKIAHTNENIIPLVTQSHPAVPNLKKTKNIQMEK